MTVPGAVPGGAGPEPPRYLVTCAPGLEGVVRGELRHAAPAVREVAGASVAGGVAVEAAGPEAAAAQLRGLRSANNVYALLGTWRDFPADRAAAEPRFKGLAAAVGAARWAAAEASVAAWDPARSRRKTAPVFRASCVRRHTAAAAKHGYTSQEVASWVGEAVAGLRPEWKVSMTRFDLEVLALLADRELSLCLCLLYRAKSPDKQPEGAQAGGDALPVQELCKALRRQLHHRPFQRHLVKTSLKPSIAFALLTLAGVREHEVVLDPLCGCGTIPLEACAALGAAGLAGDLDDAAVCAARANTSIGPAGPDPCHWDATILPLRSGAVDAVVSDLPFGVRCGKNSAVLQQLYGFLYAEMARVLRPSTGRAALLAYGKSVTEGLEAWAAETGLVEQVVERAVNMEGLDVVLLVFRRTSKPAPERQSTVRVGLPRGAEKRRKQWLSNSEKATKAKQGRQKKRRR